MTPELRQMWADLYRFFEQCAATDTHSKQWEALGRAARRILAAYKEDMFVREVLAVTMAYWTKKAEEK